MDAHPLVGFQDGHGGLPRPGDGGRQLVADLVAVGVHHVPVALGELQLVQVDEVHPSVLGVCDQGVQLPLLAWEGWDLDPDVYAQSGDGLPEAGPVHIRPDGFRRMEAYLVQARLLEGQGLLGVDGRRVEMDVVPLAEPVLEEAYHMGRAIHVQEGVPSGDPRAGGIHCLGLRDDLLVGEHPALVGVHDVEPLLLEGHGAVVAVPLAEAGHEEDHLGSVDAVPASFGDLAGAGGIALHLPEHATPCRGTLISDGAVRHA